MQGELSHTSSGSDSHSSSPSSDRRATDYENFELPCRSPSRGSPSSIRSRNAYEILPPHVLHSPIEPGSPKPDEHGRVRPPIPKPYREKRVPAIEGQNNLRGMFSNRLLSDVKASFNCQRHAFSH